MNINENCLPLYERYKKVGKNDEGKKQEAINAGFEVIGDDENHIYLLQRKYSEWQLRLKSLHMVT